MSDRKKYKQTDNETLRKNIETLLNTAISEVIGPVHLRFHYSVINHTDLEPEGDTFDIHFRVEAHPKKEPAPTT